MKTVCTWVRRHPTGWRRLVGNQREVVVHWHVGGEGRCCHANRRCETGDCMNVLKLVLWSRSSRCTPKRVAPSELAMDSSITFWGEVACFRASTSMWRCRSSPWTHPWRIRLRGAGLQTIQQQPPVHLVEPGQVMKPAHVVESAKARGSGSIRGQIWDSGVGLGSTWDPSCVV